MPKYSLLKVKYLPVKMFLKYVDLFREVSYCLQSLSVQSGWQMDWEQPCREGIEANHGWINGNVVETSIPER